MGKRREGLIVPARLRRRTVRLARELRRAQTNGELALWGALRRERLEGVKFRRQHPLGPYVVDFYAPAYRLAVEVNGSVHEIQRERDRARQRFLESQGVRFVRLPTDEVERDVATCLRKILAALRQHSQ